MNAFISKLKNNKTLRTRIITYITMIYNFFWSILKIIFGFFMHSYIYCISGIYTLLFGFIKKIFISNHSKKEVNLESKGLIVGILLTISGIAFTLYMGRLFFSPNQINYGLIWSIAIAGCSFLELGFAIYNLVKVRKKHDLLLFSLRCCNLSASFFAIVLTQVALLSATNSVNSSLYNAVTGVIAGLSVMILGFIVIGVSAFEEKRKKDKNFAQEKNLKNIEDSADKVKNEPSNFKDFD